MMSTTVRKILPGNSHKVVTEFMGVTKAQGGTGGSDCDLGLKSCKLSVPVAPRGANPERQEGQSG